MGALLLRHGGELIHIGLAGGVLVAEESHITAEWNKGKLPAGAVSVGKSGNLRPEADRKSHNADAGPAADQIVAHLVHKNEQRQHKDECDDVVRQETDEASRATHATILFVLERFSFLGSSEPLHLSVFSQFRMENRCALFLELLLYSDPEQNAAQ